MPPKAKPTPKINKSNVAEKEEIKEIKKSIKKNKDDDSESSDDDSSSASSDCSISSSHKGGATVENAVDEEETVDLNEDDDEKEDEKEDDEVDEENDEDEKDDATVDKNADKDEIVDDDDDCVYRPSKKGKLFEDDEDIEDDIEDNFFDDDFDKKNTYVSDEDRITTRKLTKYERVRIISDRAKQISIGAQCMVQTDSRVDPVELAKLELKMKVCPIIVSRRLPSGQIERIDVNKLI
jgi:DNA-directed RNA polymerase I, II, and III subunit RPABC2